MPIQAMSISHGYDQIPDIEDVTPARDRQIEKVEENRSVVSKLTSVMAIVLFTFLIVVHRNHYMVDVKEFGVHIFQTTKSRGANGMEQMTMNRLASIFPYISSVKFGNINCSDLASSVYVCPEVQGRMKVDASKRHQTIVGFGGAFTEATAYNFFKLPQHVQDKMIEMYFGSTGIGLTMGRIHINSCDFSLESYSFDDVEGDYALKYFDTEVTHDTELILPLIRLAMSAAAAAATTTHGKGGESGGIKLVASPWSPPAWMKVPFPTATAPVDFNSSSVSGDSSRSISMDVSMTGSAQPNGLKADEKTMNTWAKYISKFISAYKTHNVPIWALTPQNEPEFAAPWEGCVYNASFESSFIAQHLGPVMRAEHPDIKILAFDHNKDHLLQWTEAMMNSEAAEYVDGMAFHWYSGAARIVDGTYGYDAVNASFHAMQSASSSSGSSDVGKGEKFLIATEGCSCPGVELGDWLRAERLAHDIIFDLRSNAQAWIDWNLLVDSSGGPNHLNNNCDAPMVANEQFTNIIVQPKFHFLGHISKFVPPGAVRLDTNIVGDFKYQGVDPHIDSGIELGVFECERSSRQLWKYNAVFRTIELKYRVHDNVFTLCIGAGDDNRPYLKLFDCTLANETYLPPGVLRFDISSAISTGGVSNANQNSNPSDTSFDGLLHDIDSGLCVAVADGARQPGALLHLTDCKRESLEPAVDTENSSDISSKSSSSSSNNDRSSSRNTMNDVDRQDQLFAFDSTTGELVVLQSYASSVEEVDQLLHRQQSADERKRNGGMCVTAGWPFLTAVAFARPGERIADISGGINDWENKTTAIVIMNESPLSTSIALMHVGEEEDSDQQARNREGNSQLLVFAIDASSIQTILY